MRRRTFLRMAGGSLAVAALPRRLPAQAGWPSQPVRIIAPSAPGGSLDILSRLFGRGLPIVSASPSWWRTVPAAQAISASTRSQSRRPDGYTIMIASDPLVTNPLMAERDLRSGARFRADHHHRDVVAGAGRASGRAGEQFAEFIALARSRPDTINVGTSGRRRARPSRDRSAGAGRRAAGSRALSRRRACGCRRASADRSRPPS